MDNDLLIFTARVAKEITEYKVNTLVKAALLQLRDLGIHVQPGQTVRYLVCNEHARSYKDRVCIVETMNGRQSYDVSYYLRQIAKAAESILSPFGYTLEGCYEMLETIQKRERLHVSVLSRT